MQIRSETTTQFLDPLADGFPRTSVFDWHNVEHVLALHDGVKGVYYAVDSVDAHALGRFSTLAPPSFYTAHGLVLSRLKDKGDEYEFEGGSIGPYTIEPDTSPIHRSVHHVKATAPSFDPVAASRWGFEALEPLPARLLARRPGDLPSDSGSFFSVDTANVLLYTAKGADDGDGLVFRMTELAGVPTTVSLGTGTFIFRTRSLSLVKG